ncbi:MAG: DUF5305 family protein, partial [Candidatus Thermoplasmatota archaeon]|nr:DUF5305 family protein [Candidatus Thermoplasmatota archaeon]
MRKIRVKMNFKRITLSQTLWFSILALLIVIMLISMVTTNMAYQQPTSTKETQTILTYSSSSQFDYISRLYNNTVYNKTTLRPGEGIIFKQIVENITGTHQSRFQISESATISMTYSLTAIIQTGIWTKSYTLVPTQTSNTAGTRLTITESFPIDYRFFDTILTTINQETGITAPNPILLLRASISISARTADHTIVDSFQPEITMSLNQKTIQFSDILSMQKSGSKTETIDIEHPEIEEMRQNNLYITIAIIIILVGYLIVTKRKPTEISIVEQQLKKIKKKYGEWLVTAESNPVDPLSKTISIASIDELSRISEDLGKPMIYYPKNDSANTFYVIDDDHIYQHELLIDEN